MYFMQNAKSAAATKLENWYNEKCPYISFLCDEVPRGK